MKRTQMAPLRVALVLAAAAAVAIAAPVAAAQQEWGTKNCGTNIGYVHSYYNDGVSHYGPGGTMGYSLDYDGLWHHRERNGSYSGNWYSLGDPYLNFAGTYAACRPYG